MKDFSSEGTDRLNNSMEIYPAIDRRARRRGRRAAVDEEFLALHMRGIVRREEQHRLRNVIRFTNPAERRRLRDALLEGLLGFRRRESPAPQIGVRVAPGETTLTRMPRGDSSDAMTRAIARTPALLAA